MLESDPAKRKEHYQAMFKTYNPKGYHMMGLHEWVKLANPIQSNILFQTAHIMNIDIEIFAHLKTYF